MARQQTRRAIKTKKIRGGGDDVFKFALGLFWLFVGQVMTGLGQVFRLPEVYACSGFAMGMGMANEEEKAGLSLSIPKRD